MDLREFGNGIGAWLVVGLSWEGRSESVAGASGQVGMPYSEGMPRVTYQGKAKSKLNSP